MPLRTRLGSNADLGRGGYRVRVVLVALAALAAVSAGTPAAAVAAVPPSLSLSVPASVPSGASVTAIGRVRRAPRSARVVLQRRDGGTWVNLGRSRPRYGTFRVGFKAPASATPVTVSVRAVLVRGKRRLKASATRTIAVRAQVASPGPRPVAGLGPPIGTVPSGAPASGPGAPSALAPPGDIAVTASAVRLTPGSDADVVTPGPLTSITGLDSPPTGGAPGVSALPTGGRLVVTASRQASLGETGLTVTGTGCTATECSRRFVIQIPVTVVPTLGGMTWSDEFDGTSLDPARWIHRLGPTPVPRHDGNITPDAVVVGGGALTIRTYTEAGEHYTGMIASVASAGLEQAHGYFEARIKFNSSPGQWSAFWLQSRTMGIPVGEPRTAGVEMDIAEHRTRCVTAPPPAPCGNDISDRVQQALIWDGYGPASKSSVRLSDPLAGLGNDSWHTWGLRWTPTGLVFYYDGARIWSSTGPISQRSQYIILSSEVGEFFAGAIPPAGYGSQQTSTTNMQVDYVRVWSLG